MDWIIWVASTVAGWTSWLNPLVDAIYCMLKMWWCWTVQTLITWVLIPFFSPIIAAVPASAVPDLSFVANYWFTVNQWVPVNEMCVGYTAYCTLLVTFTVLRFVYRFVPFMG